jgi:adenine-specific DNA-methyltransferase
MTAPDSGEIYPIHDNGEEARWAMGQSGTDRHIAAGTLIWKQRERQGHTAWEAATC